MYIDDTEQVFSKSMFSLLPTSGNSTNHVEELNAELKRWGQSSDWRTVSLELSEPIHKFPVRANLTIVYRSGRRVVYVYEISESHVVVPLRVELK